MKTKASRALLRRPCSRPSASRVPSAVAIRVEQTATIDEAAEACRRSGHSRLPVHRGELDEVWGTFDVRELPAWRGHDIGGRTIADFVAYRDSLGAGGGPGASCAPRPLVRPAFLVPETRHVVDLLQDMRRRGPNMAILVDEYGGTAGLVTLRQLVGELVGGVLATGRNGAPLYVRRARGVEVTEPAADGGGVVGEQVVTQVLQQGEDVLTAGGGERLLARNVHGDRGLGGDLDGAHASVADKAAVGQERWRANAVAAEHVLAVDLGVAESDHAVAQRVDHQSVVGAVLGGAGVGRRGHGDPSRGHRAL